VLLISQLPGKKYKKITRLVTGDFIKLSPAGFQQVTIRNLVCSLVIRERVSVRIRARMVRLLFIIIVVYMTFFLVNCDDYT